MGRSNQLASWSLIPVIPFSTQIRDLPWELQLGPDDGLRCLCVLKPEWIRSVRREELGPRLARLPDDKWPEVMRAVVEAFGLSEAEAGYGRGLERRRISLSGKVAMTLLSPTRLIIECLKRRRADPQQRANLLLRWNMAFFWGELAVAGALSGQSLAMPSWAIPAAVGYLLAGLGASRCNEVVYAFLRDASRELDKAQPTTTLTSGQRIKMAMRSYIGLFINFGIICYFLPKCMYKPPFTNFVEAVYFSGVTLVTLGYGDIWPTHWFSKLLVLYEVLAGLLLVVVALAVYVSAHGRKTHLRS